MRKVPAIATKVSVQIGQSPQREYPDLQTYSLDSNVLTLVDCCSFQIIDPEGVRSNEIVLGDPVTVFMSDPRVAGGRDAQILKGLVIAITQESTDRGGTIWNIEVADLGWHLVNNCGPLFKSVMYITFQKLLDLSLDPSWGFRMPSRTDNNTNRRLMQGKALIAAPQTAVNVPIPPICFEAGETIADKLILYAKRAKQLVNVSSDGYLQIFSPNYGSVGVSATPGGSAGIDFTLHYHPPGDPARKSNNVKRATVRQAIDGIYTESVCVGTIGNTTAVAFAKGDQHPGTFKGRFSNPNALPFRRTLTFSDGDALTNSKKNPMATDHATRRGQRGLFDSWVAEYQVEGHVMGGVYITPDAMCGVDDSVNRVKGNYYISARRFLRSNGGGTLTQITVRKPNLLHGGT
jgi:hypothetical protein